MMNFKQSAHWGIGGTERRGGCKSPSDGSGARIRNSGQGVLSLDAAASVTEA
jgi:hypothetical protein